MKNYDEMVSKFEELLDELQIILDAVEIPKDFCHMPCAPDIEEDLWDNSDIILNWHISERTLATWRKKKLISYIQIGSKIWYPKLAREEFLLKNLVDNDNLKDENEEDIKLYLN